MPASEPPSSDHEDRSRRPRLLVPGAGREDEDSTDAESRESAHGRRSQEDRPVVIAAMAPPPPPPPETGEGDRDEGDATDEVDEFASTERIDIDESVLHVPASAALPEQDGEESDEAEDSDADPPGPSGDDLEAEVESPAAPPPLPEELPPFPGSAPAPASRAAAASAPARPGALPVAGPSPAVAPWSHARKPPRPVPGWALVMLGVLIGVLGALLAVRFTPLGPGLLPDAEAIPGYERGAE